MSVPEFLKPLTSLQSISIAAARDTGGAAATSQVLPGFVVDPQQQSQWCWSAVSSSVANFFKPGTWTQCQVASLIKKNDCCDPAKSSDRTVCNVDDSLADALTQVGCLHDMQWVAMSFADIKAQIAQSRPVCCRIVWLDGNGAAHFIAIGGWSTVDVGDFIIIHDPWYGLAIQKYTSFVAGYTQPGDQWSTSYWTKPAAGESA